MSHGRIRTFGTLGMAGAMVLTLGAAPTVTASAAVATTLARVQLVDQSWIMGGSGLPIPPPSYLEAVSERFINPAEWGFNTGPNNGAIFAGQPTFDVSQADTNPLFTPEGLYPFTGVKNLELDPSVAQGVQILHQQIMDTLGSDPNASMVVLGYSQSATISSEEMQNLVALNDQGQLGFDPSQLAFVLLGNPSNPVGGLLSRFDLPAMNSGLPELTIPSLGVTFGSSVPQDVPFETAIYSQEYDGFTDFPKYPLNFLSDLNALLGIATIHGHYPELTADQISTAIQLSTTEGSAQYFMIPTETLPLLSPLESIPVVGQPLYDLLEPVTRVLVNLGYGDIEDGWEQGPANVLSTFGLFPDNLDIGDVFSALGQALQQGFSDFTGDLGNLSLPSLAALPDLLSGSAVAGGLDPTAIINGLTSAFASLYATLLPTADIGTALISTLPTYSFDLFTTYLGSGDILDAVGLPLALSTGLGTLAGGFELIALENAFGDISSALGGLF